MTRLLARALAVLGLAAMLAACNAPSTPVTPGWPPRDPAHGP